jgi:creatinine amidohydrolase/Fe(II)-dependent formamide hydrolase-like protein/sterol desaturase/sphingolipid hydroxylase (fatty acid hydroxylase superfamily)
MTDELAFAEGPWPTCILVAVTRPFVDFLFSSSLIWWPFVLTSLAIAFLAYGPARAREFRRRFLSPAIWGHPSSVADYAFYLANGVVYPLVVGPMVLAGATVAAWVQAGLAHAFGRLETPLLEAGPARLLYTVAFFIALDFGRFAAHALLHDVPVLWPFHKVHHSAERLTPFTNYRIHPVDLAVMAVVPNALTGLVTGVIWYVSGGAVGLYAFFGLHVGVFAYNVIGNLRHWHVWVSFGPVLNRWLLSPVHHQIHHSSDPRHYGKNRGYALTLWDRLFGTLYVPEAEEPLTFGLGDGTDGEWHSVAALYGRPFREAWALLVRPAPTPEFTLRRRFLTLGLATAGCALLLRRAAFAGPAPRSVFLDDLTWPEVRDAIASGMTVVLIPTGGTEQNGPHMEIGKHNVIIRYTAAAIAGRLGTALVAPVISYVPEGGFAPPEGHLRFPGTAGVSDATFAALLRDAATSLALAGFTLICFVGDHGGSQPVQAKVAAELSRAWHGRGIRVANLGRYYAANGQDEWLKAHGFSAAEIGTHAGLLDTAELLAIDPAGVRSDLLSPQRWPYGATGAAGDPTRATPQLGQALLDLKIQAGVAEARQILAEMAKG